MNIEWLFGGKGWLMKWRGAGSGGPGYHKHQVCDALFVRFIDPCWPF